MTRVLWVTAESPDRNLGGGSIRQAHLLEALARRAETHLLLAGHLGDQETLGVLSGVTEVDNPSLPQPINTFHRRIIQGRRALFDAMPEDVTTRRGVRASLAKAMSMAGGFDIVSVEHTALASLLPRQRQNRWSLTMHQLGSRRAAHELEIVTKTRVRWALRREMAKASRYERWAMGAYDLVFVPSREDAANLGDAAVVVPNGVELERFSPTPVPDNHRLVLVGTMDYLPNIDGAIWFCTEVLPRVRESVPDTTVDIVGRAPVARVLDLGRLPGVTVSGDVESTVPYLAAARAALVPLRIGSGTRLKALEAMASNRPAVGTPIGLEGLGLVSGRNAVIAGAATLMAAELVALLTDHDLAVRIAAGGRSVAETFSWDRISSVFVDSLLASTRRVRSTG